ncbi:MAG: threonylcarbamoyl-AMP synthase [Bacteroidales bacterium]|jgi:tRNA threonylcarbamoyl adenosine modification protein (Sua5/YciO/YrdC/YwlC family)|nr:threonylcarbamoyl-AMP synthase [Bacteroidales bacterium]
MLIKIHPDNPDLRRVRQIVECLKQGGIVIYPTDTIYGFACDITKFKVIEKIAQLKGRNLKNERFSIICYDLSSLSDYTRPISNSIYRIMKKALPGPYTFILEANNNVPKIFHNKRNSIGIRVPENNIARTLVEELGNPIVSTSVRQDDDIEEYLTDPELIYERFGNLVDIVIDGGYGDYTPSTVIDCTGDEPVVIREGKGETNFLL